MISPALSKRADARGARFLARRFGLTREEAVALALHPRQSQIIDAVEKHRAKSNFAEAPNSPLVRGMLTRLISTSRSPMRRRTAAVSRPKIAWIREFLDAAEFYGAHPGQIDRGAATSLFNQGYAPGKAAQRMYARSPARPPSRGPRGRLPPMADAEVMDEHEDGEELPPPKRTLFRGGVPGALARYGHYLPAGSMLMFGPLPGILQSYVLRKMKPHVLAATRQLLISRYHMTAKQADLALVQWADQFAEYKDSAIKMAKEIVRAETGGIGRALVKSPSRRRRRR
jgi:hypothetical protein